MFIAVLTHDISQRMSWCFEGSLVALMDIGRRAYPNNVVDRIPQSRGHPRTQAQRVRHL
jgi:hypothetical protein